MAAQVEARRGQQAASDDGDQQRSHQVAHSGDAQQRKERHDSPHARQVQADLPAQSHQQAEDFAAGGGHHDLAQQESRGDFDERQGAEQIEERPQRQRQVAVPAPVDPIIGELAQRAEHDERQSRQHEREEHHHPHQIDLNAERIVREDRARKE